MESQGTVVVSSNLNSCLWSGWGWCDSFWISSCVIWHQSIGLRTVVMSLLDWERCCVIWIIVDYSDNYHVSLRQELNVLSYIAVGDAEVYCFLNFCKYMHRWIGRYEAHLWDKSTWNLNQNKKGKQGFSFLFSPHPTKLICFLCCPYKRFHRWNFAASVYLGKL